MASAKDGKEEVMSWTRDIIVTVLSGTPVLETKARGDAGYTAITLDDNPTKVTIPSGHFRFTLGGGTASFVPAGR